MTSLNIKQLKQMFAGGAKVISDNFEHINELNVFPVPDGDTGSNMMITITSAVKEIQDVEFNDLFSLGRQFSRALLMNARGNSGVIFSQIIKGFVRVFAEGAKEMTIANVIEALTKAKEISYAAVSSPVEGTILTVIRVTSEKISAKRTSYKSIEDLFKDIIKESEAILDKTPDFLVELKNAGVVDSGGYGLVCFFKGMYQALTCKEFTTKKPDITKKSATANTFVPKFIDNNEGFGYCCEFICKLGAKVVADQKQKANFTEQAIKAELLKIGDSLAVVRDEDILKVHVHSINPYKVLLIGQKYGEFSKVKIENMTFQFLERNPGMSLQSSTKKNESLKSSPVIVVTVPTQPLVSLFKDELAVDHVICCKNNFNPSIQEFINALNAANSSKAILLVDDGNMMLAAKEAINLFTTTNSNAKVELINTTDISATYALSLAYNPEIKFEENIKILRKLNKRIAVGKISKSVKMIKYSHISVKKDDYIGIIEKKILSSSKNLDIVIKQTLAKLYRENKSAKYAEVFCGLDVPPTSLKVIEKEFNEKYSISVNFIKSDESIYLFHFVLH